MYAITTKYHGPTNHRGSRVIATAGHMRVTHNWDYGMTAEANHDAAARKMAQIRKWDGLWVRGTMPGGRGNAYVRCLGGPLKIDEEA